MNPKRIFIVSTVALTITIGGGIWNGETNVIIAGSSLEDTDRHNISQAAQDEFLQALGASSDDEVYNAMLDGKSLADIADGNDTSVHNIINLQINDMTMQLDRRLANGNLSPADYEAQKAELADVIKRSVYGKQTV